MNIPPPDTQAILLRVGLAVVAGGALGMERETHGRAAGFRTTLLVTVASALAMIISALLFDATATDSWRPDPARLAAGVLAGMGFLGAGTIIRHTNVIRGVTTAATLWFSAILGMSFGAGLFVPGIVGLVVALVALVLLPAIEHRLPVDWFSKLIVTMDQDAMTEAQIRERLEGCGLRIKGCELHYDLVNKQKTVLFEVKLLKSARFEMGQRVIASLSQTRGLREIKWI
jgi:putative Mg2+ transporter-C (MgtC) family protein